MAYTRNDYLASTTFAGLDMVPQVCQQQQAKAGEGDDGGDDGGSGPNFDPNTPAELSRARADLRRLRRELVDYRAERDQALQDRDAARQAQTVAAARITELEAAVAGAETKAADELKALKTTHSEELKAKDTALVQDRIKGEVKLAAIQAGVVDADDFLKIVDTSKLAYAEDGTLAGVKELVDATRTAKGHLFGGVPAAGDLGTTSHGTGPRPTAPGAKKISEMSREEYEADKAQLLSRR